MAINRNKVQKQAEKYVAAGKIETGIAEYQKIVSENPRDLGTLNKIGDLYVRLNKRSDAIRNFTTIAEIYADDGFFLKAIAIYKKITKLDPSRMDALQRLASLYSKQGLHTEARAQYLALAQAHLKAEDPDKAIEIYEALVELEPRNLQHRLALAELKVKRGRPEEAARTFLDLGEDLEKQGNRAESARVYEMALKASEGDPSVAERLAVALATSGQFDRALKISDEVLASHPDNAAMLEARAMALEGAGQPKEAEESARHALRTEPSRAEALLCLARLLTARGALNEACEEISGGMDALMGAGKGPEAVAALEEILSREPGSRPALEDLYRLQTMLDDKAGTLFAGEKLAEVCASEGRFSEALVVARRLAEMDPDSAAHADRVARIEAEAGGADEAPEAPPEAPEVPDEEESVEIRAEEEPEPEVFSRPALDAAAGEVAAPPEEPPEVEEPGEEGEAGEAESLSPEDEEFIAERFTEADVFVKYGLADRAIEQLASITERFPWHVLTRQRLRDLLLEEGDRARAAVEAAALGKIHLCQGDPLQAQAALDEARSIDTGCPLIAELEGLLAGAEGAAGPPAAAPAAPQEEIAPVASTDEEIFIEEEPELEETAPVEETAEEEVPAMVAGEAEGVAMEPERVPAAEAPEEEAPPQAGEPPRESGGDLFDLAAELDAELFAAQEAEEAEGALSAIEASPEGMTHDEIVSALKQEVDKQIEAEDYQTHYDLGIAYKEMGLADEAIAEFQFASKDPKLLPPCCSMLGLCFREKGMLSLAVKWYRKGLDALASGGDEDQMNGLRYDMAEALEQMGEYRQAMDLLVEVYGADSQYRDVAKRMKALEERLGA